MAPDELVHFVARTRLNGRRFATGLPLFREDEFGTGPEAPTKGHVRAVNALLKQGKAGTAKQNDRLEAAAAKLKDGSGAGDDALAALLDAKDRNQAAAREVERVWEFYLNIFEQRASPYKLWLRGLDRIALDCYQAVYLGLGAARSVPAPAPMSYIEAGFGPATYRRGVRLSRLGKRANPFPLVKVPFHRMLNPWGLGAVPHEVAHNLQNDLGLWGTMPGRMGTSLRAIKAPAPAVRTWMRWHKETYADLLGILLIGPAYVTSLMDVVGRGRGPSARFNDEAVHPTPVLRVPLAARLIERMGFPAEAMAVREAWAKLYPTPVTARLPAYMRERTGEQFDAAIDAICFTPEKAYGGKRLAEVTRFQAKHVGLVEQAARRLAAGDSPGILPERFMIPAAATALRRRLAEPAVIHRHFYELLGRG